MIIMHSRPNLIRTALSAAAMATLLSACTVGPNFVRPAPQTPAHWSARATAPPATPDQRPSAPTAVTEQATELPDWWSGFGDPELSSLIERSVNSNLDVRTAVLRIDEARAQRAIAAAAYWPTLSLDASYSRQRLSETTPTGALFSSVGNLHLPGSAGLSIPNPYNQFQLSADASWEIDQIGRAHV